MSFGQTRPEHLKQALTAHGQLAPAAALDRLMRLDPVLGSYVAERQQRFVAALDSLPISAVVFAEAALEQLRAMTIALEMQRLAFNTASAEAVAEDEEAAAKAIACSEPPYGVIG